MLVLKIIFTFHSILFNNNKKRKEKKEKKKKEKQEKSEVSSEQAYIWSMKSTGYIFFLAPMTLFFKPVAERQDALQSSIFLTETIYSQSSYMGIRERHTQ